MEASSYKRCPLCTKELPLDQFYMKQDRKRPRPGSYCKTCLSIRYKNLRAAGVRAKRRPDYMRRFFLRTQYGMTLEDYEQLLAKQDGVCAICTQAPADGKCLAVDHDHETGAIRGLLCMICNTHLGILESAWATEARTYLEAAP